MRSERVAIFIDGSNFYYAVKNSHNVSVDFEHFINYLVDGRRLLRTYYYTTNVPEEKDKTEARKQQKFLSYLRNVPYFEIKTGRLERRYSDCRSCNKRSEHWVEKGVDVALAVDMVKMAYGQQNAYDTAVIVSGDGDFTVAVKTVKDAGKNVECAYISRKGAFQLSSCCDRFIEITKDALVK